MWKYVFSDKVLPGFVTPRQLCRLRYSDYHNWCADRLGNENWRTYLEKAMTVRDGIRIASDLPVYLPTANDLEQQISSGSLEPRELRIPIQKRFSC